MNSRRFILPLFWFNLRQLPSNVWLLFLLLLSQAVIFQGLNFWFHHTTWESSSIDTNLNMLPIFFCGVIGVQFMVGAGTMVGSSVLVPTGEFLLARAIPRSTAYFTRTAIIFLAMLAFPLINLGFTVSQPELRLTVYHSKTQSSDAYDRLAQLQTQFPDSHVLPSSRALTEILVIPHGQLLVATWQFWIVFLMALLLQSAALFAISFKKPISILVAVYLAPLLLFVLLDTVGRSSGIMEGAFFFFAHHWVAFIVLTFGLFNFIQRFALKRIQDLEVI